MARTILLAEDDPRLRKLMLLRLRDAGYEVATADDGVEALEKAQQSPPDAIVSDVLMPGLDGFKLCQAVRQDPRLVSVPVVLMSSASIEQADLVLAQSAGASAYVLRTPECGEVIGALEDSLGRGPAPPAEDNPALVAELQDQFLSDGQIESRSLLDHLHEDFNPESAKQVAHRWAGVGGTLGFPELSQLACQIEQQLDDPAAGGAAGLQRSLEEIGRRFAEARAERSLPARVRDFAAGLAGKRIGLVGFEPAESARLARAFEQARALAAPLAPAEIEPDSATARGFDLLVLNLSPALLDSRWAGEGFSSTNAMPLLVAGTWEAMLAGDAVLPEQASDFLLAPWCPEEALLRAARILCRQPAAARVAAAPPSSGEPVVVVADDDLTIAALLTATLRSHGIRCHIARHGREALEMTRQLRPSALVLDVNMPRMDGFQVLTELKHDPLTASTPVVLLTVRRQEVDVLRGFGLGADDYVTKPFSPVELLARLKRVMRPAQLAAGA